MAANQALLSAVGTQLGTSHPVYLLLSRLTRTQGSGGSPGGVDIVFRPGAPSTGPFFATWAEVETAIAAAGSVCTLWFDGSLASCVIPNTANVDGKSFLTMMGASDTVTAFGGGTIVTVQSGAKFKNVRSVSANLGFEGVITTPVFEFDTGKIFTVELDSGFKLLAGSTSAFIKVAPGETLLVRVDLGSYFDNQLVPAIPVVDATAAANFALFVTRAINAAPGSFQGAGATFLFFIHDASTNANDAANYTTGFAPLSPNANDIFFDKSEGLFYDDLRVAPPFIGAPPHAYNAQLAFDAIKGLLPATAAGRNVIVFNPGIPVSAGNVYKTWAEVQAVASATRGPLTIEIYPNAVLTAPGLNYPDGLKLTGVGFFGPNPTPIETDNSGWNMAADGLEIHNLEVTVKANATAPFEGGNAGCETVLSGTTKIIVDPTSLAAAFSFHGGAPGPDIQRLILRDQARLVAPAGPQVVVNCFGNTTLNVFAYDQSVVEDGAIVFGGIGSFVARQGTGAKFSPNQTPSLLPLGAPVMGTYVEEITPDPVPITINHNLQSKFCVVELYNNNDVAVPCDTSAATGAKVTVIDVNTVELDLSFFTADPGWHVVVRR